MSERHVTAPTYWLGRIAMGVAMERQAPRAAREALDAYLKSAAPTPELRDMLRKEMKK